MPGQTETGREPRRACRHASMEGRAIARPNSERCRVVCVAPQVASMEGRAIARPNQSRRVLRTPGHDQLQWRAGQLPGQTGDCPPSPPAPRLVLQWRAGQLPGQTGAPTGGCPSGRPLQWRAGQLPGQTRRDAQRQSERRKASMEGRAIARPNPATSRNRRRRVPGFNGGPGNCPAKPR